MHISEYRNTYKRGRIVLVFRQWAELHLPAVVQAVDAGRMSLDDAGEQQTLAALRAGAPVGLWPDRLHVDGISNQQKHWGWDVLSLRLRSPTWPVVDEGMRFPRYLFQAGTPLPLCPQEDGAAWVLSVGQGAILSIVGAHDSLWDAYKTARQAGPGLAFCIDKLATRPLPFRASLTSIDYRRDGADGLGSQFTEPHQAVPGRLAGVSRIMGEYGEYDTLTITTPDFEPWSQSSRSTRCIEVLADLHKYREVCEAFCRTKETA